MTSKQTTYDKYKLITTCYNFHLTADCGNFLGIKYALPVRSHTVLKLSAPIKPPSTLSSKRNRSNAHMHELIVSKCVIARVALIGCLICTSVRKTISVCAMPLSLHNILPLLCHLMSVTFSVNHNVYSNISTTSIYHTYLLYKRYVDLGYL